MNEAFYNPKEPEILLGVFKPVLLYAGIVDLTKINYLPTY